MSPTPPPSPRADDTVRVTRSHLEAEDALWLDLYRRINVYDTAVVLAEFMRKHPHVQQSRPALALRAAETIRRDELRQQRITHVAGFVRRCIVVAAKLPFKIFRSTSKPAADLMFELIPGNVVDPTQYELRVRALLNDPRFASIARDALVSASASPPARSVDHQSAPPETQVKAA